MRFLVIVTALVGAACVQAKVRLSNLIVIHRLIWPRFPPANPASKMGAWEFAHRDFVW